MPTYTSQTSKATIRHAVIGVGGYSSFTTTTGGTAGGIDLICSALIGYSQDRIIDRWFLLTSGTYTGQFRRAISFAAATGTVTFANTFGGTVATSVTFEVYQVVHRPDMFTNAVNAAILKLGSGEVPTIYKVVNSHIITDYERQNNRNYGSYYAVPRNIRRVMRITRVASGYVRDEFNRAASATDMGNGWVATAGTWGVTSELGYSVTDTDADIASRPELITDGAIQVDVTGTTNHDSVYRTLALAFHVREDYTGAIDTTNCLLVRLLGTGALAYVDLRKRDGGSESSLTTATQTTVNGTYNQLRVEFIGANIAIWVDDVLLKEYTLTGANLKYAQYPRCFMRLDKAGAPGTAARFDNFYAFSATTPYEWTDWKQSDDNLTLIIPNSGNIRPSGLLRVEGTDTLTLLTEDTTAQTLDSDSTAKLEIETTDPAWQKLVTQSRTELFRLMARDLLPNGQLSPQSQGYLAAAQDEEAAAKRMPGMPFTAAPRHPMGIM